LNDHIYIKKKSEIRTVEKYRRPKFIIKINTEKYISFKHIHQKVYFALQMDDSGPDEIQVLPEKNRKRSSFSSNTTNPARPIRFLTRRHRANRGNSNAAFVQEMETIDEPKSSVPSTTYGYLAHIQSLKSLMTPEDKSLPKKVR